MLLLGASWLALGVTGHAGDPGIVRISASIFSVESDGNEKPLGEAEVTAPLGEWARFRKGQDIPSVVQYSLPSIPKEISESVVGASGEAPEFETNELSVVIPSHPEKVETLELGLSGRFRPRVLANGTLTVDAEIGYREVLESIEKAEPIYFVKKNAAGKEKKILVTRNETRAPVTRSRKTSVHYTRKKGERKGVVIPVSGPDSDSSLIVRMKVAPVEPGEKNTKAIPAGNFFYITSRFVEITEGEMENEEDLYPDKPVLSDAEFQMWIRRINQQKGVDLLSAPSLVVKPGQDGRIEVAREFIYPTSYQPPTLEDIASTGEAEENCATMAVAQLREFLEHGNIKNSVNFPTTELARGHGNTHARLTFTNHNKPGVLGQVLSIFAEHEINIVDMVNKSRDDIAYNILDMSEQPSQETLNAMKAISAVLNVRVL